MLLLLNSLFITLSLLSNLMPRALTFCRIASVFVFGSFLTFFTSAMSSFLKPFTFYLKLILILSIRASKCVPVELLTLLVWEGLEQSQMRASCRTERSVRSLLREGLVKWCRIRDIQAYGGGWSSMKLF